jgi:hypothetical protein
MAMPQTVVQIAADTLLHSRGNLHELALQLLALGNVGDHGQHITAAAERQ